MNCPTKRYWITYFTNKGDHLLYFDHWLTVSWSRYDKRLKPPSEGALRVRSSPQRLLHRPFKAFIHSCLFAFASYFAYSNLHPVYPILFFFLITLQDDHAHILYYCLIFHSPPLRSTSACPSSPSPPRTSRACTTRLSSSSSRSGSTLVWSTMMETGERKKFISWISSQVPNPERSPPSRRHLEARHLLHQARYFQGKSVESPIKDGFHANSFVNIGINTIL